MQQLDSRTMDKTSSSYQLFLFTACSLLVALFVNLFSLFSMLQKVLPESVLTVLPIAATLSVVVLLVFILKKRAGNLDFSWPWLIAGAFICLIALVVPDQKFPVKRIHVIEYMGLCCLVRYAMSWRLSGFQLLFFSVLATTLFGVHDELLQGIHSQRTYGLRDIAVNGLGALGGGMIYHGAGLFSRTGRAAPLNTAVHIYLCWLLLAVSGFTVPLPAYRNEAIAYWPLLPLSAGLVYWQLYYVQLKGDNGYGCQVLSCLSFSLFPYPFVINAFALTFY